jgi:hypothetical protein
VLLGEGCRAEQGKAAGTVDSVMWLWWRRCVTEKGTAGMEEQHRHMTLFYQLKI